MRTKQPKLKHHYEQHPTLQTERLILRQIVPDDAADLDKVITNEEMYKYWGAPLSNNEKSGERYIRRNLTRKPNEKPHGITWGIALKEDNRIIGEIFINRIEDDRMAHIGYRVGMEHWSKGIATEAAKAVVAFCFEQTELKRLYTQVISGNDASCRVLEKSGFIKEGFLRESKLFGLYCDYHIYGYLRSEYLI